MYSWVASFFTESEDGQITDQQQSLYAEQQKQQPQDDTGDSQTTNTKNEEWTWIEVIEDRDDHALIFVQSDESLRHKNAATDTEPNGAGEETAIFGPSTNLKRKRRIAKNEAISRKIFKRSLYTDLPLMRRAARGLRQVNNNKGAAPLDIQLKNLFKVQKTTCELLSSSTFPVDNMLMVQDEFEYDVSYLLNNLTFLRSLLEGVLRHEVHLDRK